MNNMKFLLRVLTYVVMPLFAIYVLGMVVVYNGLLSSIGIENPPVYLLYIKIVGVTVGCLYLVYSFVSRINSIGKKNEANPILVATTKLGIYLCALYLLTITSELAHTLGFTY